MDIASGLSVNIGYAYDHIGDSKDAINFYKKAFREYTITGKGLIISYYNFGVLTNNKTLLWQALHLDPTYIPAYKGLIKSYKNDINTSSNKLYIFKQLLKLYGDLLFKDKANSISYGIKVCKLSRKILSSYPSQKLWILMNVNEHLNPISKKNINTLKIGQINNIFHFIENCLGFLNEHLITSFSGYKLNTKRFYQYTSLNTLSSICNVDKNRKFNNKEPFKLRLYNSEYMNDPSEGKELFEKIEHISNSNDNKSHIEHIIKSIYHKDKNSLEELHSSHVYIASLSNVKPLSSDSMSMWDRYGDFHKGIALGLDVYLQNNSSNDVSSNKLSDRSNYNKIPLNLYKVSYNKDDSDDDIHYLSNIARYMETFDDNFLKDDHISNLLKFQLDKIRFVFKSSDYKQEKEYRIMEDSSDFSNTKYDKGNEKLYIEVDNKSNVSAKLDEIVFGNRCKNYNWLPIVRKQLGNNIIMKKSNENIRN